MTKHILVVEDQEDNRQILRDLLTNAGYEMTEAVNGREALAEVANRRPDLILVDIQLPVMDGYEATRRIRTNPDLKSVPIIAVTSYALAGDETKALAAGCDAYVTKPFIRASCWRRSENIYPIGDPWLCQLMVILDEQVSSRIAKVGGEARREWVVDIAVDSSNRSAVGDTPAGSTSIYPNRRSGDEANERENGGPPGDIDAHGVSSRSWVRPDRGRHWPGHKIARDLSHQG